jgi:hypothetical protein
MENLQDQLFPIDPPDREIGYTDHLQLVIASLPRSATTWLRNVFEVLKVSAGHETIGSQSCFEHRPPILRVQVEISGFIQPYTASIKRRKKAALVHLIRHPVTTLNSTLNHFESVFPDKKKGWDHLCKCYLSCHKGLDETCSLTIYTEQLTPQVLKNLLAMIDDRRSIGTIKAAMNQASIGRSTPEPHFSWDDLPEELQHYASTHHGYEA